VAIDDGIAAGIFPDSRDSGRMPKQMTVKIAIRSTRCNCSPLPDGGFEPKTLYLHETPDISYPCRIMATVRPFRGLRPRREFAAEVAARPYDVLTTEEARIEAAGNPLSFLHVGKPEIDMPVGIDPSSPEVYARAKTNLDLLVERKILEQDPAPRLYVYAQTMGAHRQYGIAACVPVDEYQQGLIRKHELTRPDKEDDRTRHILATNAQTGPIFLTYRMVPSIDALVMRIASAPAEYDFLSSDGVRHQLWVVADEPTLESIVRLFRDVPLLYIADGHHRSAAAARAALERRRRNPGHTGDEEYGAFLAVIIPDTQLQILEYNRLVRDLNGLKRDRLLDLLERDFDVTRTRGRMTPMRKGEFGLYLEGGWHTLIAHAELLDTTDPVERLDISVLQNRVLGPLLAIEDQRTSKRIDFVGGIRGTGELEHRVNSGEMAAAFSLYPTSVGELLAIADANRIMPPKSTWFEPKLRDGLLVHGLE
jgi:uncharacterized protein (DUF1015 family)